MLLQFLGDDEKQYEVSLSPRAAAEAIVAILDAALSVLSENQLATLYQDIGKLLPTSETRH